MEKEKKARRTTARKAENGAGPSQRTLQQLTQAETIADMVRAFSTQAEEISRQLEFKDQQIQMKDNQLEARAREIAQLHEMLTRAQSLSISLSSKRQRSWWKRIFGIGSETEESASLSAT